MSGALVDHLEHVNETQAAGTAVAPRGKTARDLVIEMEPQFRRALPGHIDAGRFTRLALTALRTVPKLAECSGESILAGLTQAAQLGLEIDAVRGQAYLIPRWNKKTRRNEASFQVGYKGLIDLAGRGGITVRARDVCTADLFQVEDGLEPILRHVPELKKDRGDAWAYFAVATFPDRAEREFLVMSRAEVQKHRDKFAPRYNGNVVGPWVEHFDAMARKTLILRLLGQLPLPVELADAIAFEDVPLDVTPDDPELPPAPAEEAEPLGRARSGGTAPPATNEGDAPPPSSSSDVPPAGPPTDGNEEELARRRALAVYLIDEARKADHEGVKKWQAESGVPNDSRSWTAEQIAAVIDWITAEPDEPAATE